MATYKPTIPIQNNLLSKVRLAALLYSLLMHIAEADWADFKNVVKSLSIVIDPQAANVVTITVDGTIPANQLSHLFLEEVV